MDLSSHLNKKENKVQSASDQAIRTGRYEFQLEDNRPKSIIQKKQIAAIAGRQSGSAVVQKKTNKTGLPDNLKSGIENLSGYSMDDVKVNYDSAKPAQLNAHAYAQGSEIHLAPGQEKHLPHEAWHVVQQKQGRVKPTIQMKGRINVNDDKNLEKEADMMGVKAQIEPGKSVAQPGATVNLPGQGTIQKKGNKRRRTPQQQAQSEKFWKQPRNWKSMAKK